MVLGVAKGRGAGEARIETEGLFLDVDIPNNLER